MIRIGSEGVWLTRISSDHPIHIASGTYRRTDRKIRSSCGLLRLPPHQWKFRAKGGIIDDREQRELCLLCVPEPASRDEIGFTGQDLLDEFTIDEPS